MRKYDAATLSKDWRAAPFLPSQRRPMTKPLFHTIGYSGFTPETFAATLQAAGIEVLLDVRRNPVSRKKGFSKAGLDSLLHSVGMEYVHIPELGVPMSLREELRDGGELGDYLHQFGRFLLTCDDALNRVLKLSLARPCCLMCLEKNPAECHRSVVADELRARANGDLPIRHLSGENSGSGDRESYG